MSPAVPPTPRGSPPVPVPPRWHTWLGCALRQGCACRFPVAHGDGPQVGIRPRVGALSLVQGEDVSGRRRSPWDATRPVRGLRLVGRKCTQASCILVVQHGGGVSGGSPAQGSHPVHIYTPLTLHTAPVTACSCETPHSRDLHGPSAFLLGLGTGSRQRHASVARLIPF